MRKLSFILIVLGLILIGTVFGPIIVKELGYRFDKMAGVSYSSDPTANWNFQKPLMPPNTDFAIVIPKIKAVAPIIDNVDPFDSDAYLKALREGVAHASGTVYPGQIGNVFLFAHSTDAFYNVGKYNAVFFLIGHLENDDEIDLFYRGIRYTYSVYDKKVVAPEDTEYLGTLGTGEKTLTLQTCYPPGTTIKRLVVLAKLSSPK